jgi:gliding motility-associated-like protein
MSLIRSTVYIFLVIVLSCTKGYSQVPIIFNIGSGSGPQGSQVCVDFTVEDFIKVTSTQFVIRFDPKVIALNTPIIVTNSCLNENGMGGLSTANFNVAEIADGYVNFIWFDLNTTGITLDGCEILFTLCFDLIGDPCESSDICITESGPVPFEFVQIDCITGEENDFPPIINKGEITIDPDGYAITSAFCSSDDASNSGSITFSGSGGTGPYNWEVSPGGASGTGLNDCETATIDDLGPGTYTVTLIDANNVVTNEVITISTNSEFPFILTLDGTNPTCFKTENGSINVVDIEGGEGPFTYEWSTFQFFEDSLIQLGAGDYDLTITDINGCTASSSVALEVDTIKLNFTVISDPSCDGSSDGIVSITAEGGTPYAGNGFLFDIGGINGTIYFSGGGPLNPFTPGNLPAGCFEVVASDNATFACTSDPIEFCLEAGSFSTLDIDVTNISCFGECDGMVVVTAGTVGNFSFMVTDPDGNAVTGMNTNLAFDTDNLCSGIYDMTVNDVIANCSIDTFFTIIEPELLVLSVLDSLGPGCGGGDGMMTFEANGGTEDYIFEWNDAFDQSTRVNMGGGNYSVTVTDANGCQDSISFTFQDGGTIGLNAFVCNAVTCGGAMDGSICADVTSPGVFSFTWEDASGMSLGTGGQIDGVGGGIYYVTATDGLCTDVDTVIVAPGEMVSVSIVQEDPTCPDSPNGTLTATLATGTNPASYIWTEPPSTLPLSTGAVLLAGVGIYNLNVIDGNGCEIDTLIELTPPTNVINVDITNIVDNTCFGECEGEATFTASGGPDGSNNYVFFVSGISTPINPGGNVATVSTICGGGNWVYAIDGTCASDTFWFTVPDADPILLNESNSLLVPPSCAGGDDGSIMVEVEGGNSSSYDILWVNEGIMGPSLSGLTAGAYIYNVTDGSNCVFVDTIVLETPDTLMVQVNPFTTIDISCFSGSMGRIGLITSGGNSGQLTYTWDPPVSNVDFAENLSPGLYSVTVSDTKGCTAETSYELTSADPIVAVISAPDEPDCFGGSTCVGVESATGGVGDNFTFTINNGPRFPLDTCLNIFAGPYLITVFDSVGCAVDTMININQPEEIIVDAGPDITIDLGSESDPISVSIVSEVDIDSILWNPFIDIDCNTLDCQVVTFSPTASTDYTVTVIDENGCMASDDISVIVDLTRNVYFSNIFSPNGDNQNDFFQLATGSGVVEISFFKMFDRWGNMVHQEVSYMPYDGLHPGWDGRYNNKDVEAGVYVYFAEVLFEDNVRILYKGDVTVVR